MRRILLMVFAVAMFVGLTTTAAQASSNSGPGKGHKCTYGAWPSGMCKPKPKDCAYGMKSNGKCKPKPDECKHGVKNGQCMPDPDECKYGMKNGECKPKPPECPFGKDDEDECNPPPVVVPPPEEGVCAKSDLVLLEDLLKGTGALLCVYLGDNSPNATADKDCPGSLLALPIDNLVGACLFLPPAEVGANEAPDVEDASMGIPLKMGGPLDGLIKTLTGLLKMA